MASDARQSWRVEVAPTADRELKRLSNENQRRALVTIGALSGGPPRGTRKLAGRDDEWRVRVGDIRVIFEMRQLDRVIIVHHVLPRGRAYRDS